MVPCIVLPGQHEHMTVTGAHVLGCGHCTRAAAAADLYMHCPSPRSPAWSRAGSLNNTCHAGMTAGQLLRLRAQPVWLTLCGSETISATSRLSVW
jgi:hypothetical protein